MLPLTRRNALKAAGAGIGVIAAVAVAGCNSAQAAIMLAETDLTYAENVWAALNKILTAIPANLPAFSTISSIVAQAETAISAVSGLVNHSVSTASVASILTLLQTGVTDAEQFLPGNPYLEAASVTLALLSDAWSMVAPAAGGAVSVRARPSPEAIAHANALLSPLPRSPKFAHG